MRWLCISFLVLAGCSSGAVAPRSAVDLARHGDFDIVHVSIALSWSGPLSAEAPLALHGREEVELEVLREGVAALALDARGLEIASVTAAPLAVDWTHDGAMLLVRLAEPVAAGTRVVLEIAYTARQGRGLSVAEGVVWTGFHACDWMVCRQEPFERATWALRFELPAGAAVFATGTRAHDGEATVFRLDAPVPAYVVGFAAGALVAATRRSASGVELEVVTRTALDAAAREGLLALGEQALGELEAYFDAPLPHARYTQVFVPGRAAQESAGLVLLSESYAAAVLEDPGERYLIVHELVHQWWGNLVTCASWGDFWLNEGVTTWVTARVRGEAVYQRERGLWRERVARAVGEGKDRALHVPGIGVAEAGGSLVYHRGALALDALAAVLGDVAVQQTLRRLVADAGPDGLSLTTDAFLEALLEGVDDEARAAEAREVFRTWVEAPHTPAPP